MARRRKIQLELAFPEAGAGEARERPGEGTEARAANAVFESPTAFAGPCILAADPANCGAIAFSRSGDPALGDFEDAVVIRTFGEVDAALA